jgi:outer membrane protein TolC
MVDVGVRSEILLRRPDVAIAEFMMRAAASDVGAARADLFPKLVLSASAGYESGATSSLFDSASRVLGVAPQLSVPVFQRGRLKAERSAAIARFEMTYAEYRKTVLQAIAEAESWLVSLATEQQSHDEYARAFEETDKAAELAGKLYDRGLINYLELLDAQREVLQSEDAWVQSRIRKQLAFVNLYIALGGGWQQYPGR